MKRVFAALLIAGCILTGCSSEETADRQDQIEGSGSLTAEQETIEQENEKKTFPGRYTVPEGWVKVEKHSTDQKIFYAREGYDKNTVPDNISIEVGTNPYSVDEHMRFKAAILQQLSLQIKGVDAAIYGVGSATEQGDIVYSFTIQDNRTGIITTQHYIVGDYRYCLIHLTNHTGADDVEEAAQTMVTSFVWNNPE